MKHLLILILAASIAVPASAQEAIATELPPSLRAKQEKARAAAEAKAERDAAAQEKAAAAQEKAAAAKERDAQAREERAATQRSAAPVPRTAESQAAAAPAPRRVAPEPTAAAVVAADGSSGQPVVVSATVEKCLECKTTTKKRIAVLPTRVGSVAADAGSSPESLGQIVSDRLEAILNARPELLVLGRGSLQGVLAEQDLGARGVTNAELAPQRGRVIPAELLLHVTLDRVDVRQDSRRVANSNAVSTLERAQNIERQALTAREEAADDERSAAEAFNSANALRAQNQQLQAQMQQQAQQGILSRSGMNLGLLASALGTYGEASSTRQAEESLEAAKAKRIDAERKFLQARQMKEQAERAASTDLIETKRTTATISVIWRTVDTVTGEVLAGDTINLSDSSTDERRVVASAGTATEVSATNRAQGLVNKLIDASATQVVHRMSSSIEKVPFRGRIVRVDRGGVIVNVGRNLGVEAGDTFAVRRIDLSLIDPATGRSLAGPGTLEGMIRVTEVSDQVAKAVVVQSAGKLSRGDLLEWVGIYK